MTSLIQHDHFIISQISSFAFNMLTRSSA